MRKVPQKRLTADKESWRGLIDRSLLENAARLHAQMRTHKHEDTGKDNLTFLQRPYARVQTREAVHLAPVWFTAYLPSIIGPERDGEMMRPLETLCQLDLWNRFAELGVQAVHTGPCMKAGGLTFQNKPYDSIDGWFDPIALQIDPVLGSDRDYSRLVWIAENMPHVVTGKKLNAAIIGDIVPGHTGLGPDFYLALKGVGLYPGLYVLARIDQVLDRNDKRYKRVPEQVLASLNSDIPNACSADDHEISRLLTSEEIDALVGARVIPGRPQRGMGAQAGFGWSITRSIEGSPDENGNTRRRWIYLHFFHPKQPTLNFFDPGYAAWRMTTGQLNYVMWNLRSAGVRLDANAFLGIEPFKRGAQKTTGDSPATNVIADPQTWSEAHPLSQAVTNMLAWHARRLGGFSFQEMNMPVPDIASSGEFGPDLAYDFITRPACEHAVLTQDAGLLAFMYREMARFRIDPISLVHALQNHDEFTYELVHLRYLESVSDKPGAASAFAQSADTIRAEMRRVALHRFSENAEELRERKPGRFYNQESPNGLCTTLPGLLAATLGCQSLDEAVGKAEEIKKGHLLFAAFNALQPGVFALSGWDLVGALPLEQEKIPAVLLNAGSTQQPDLQKDYRWVNRGAYRLLSSFTNPEGQAKECYGCFDLPEARALYGPLDLQRSDPDSFFAHLGRILELRRILNLPVSHLAGLVPDLPANVFGLELQLENPCMAGGVLPVKAIVLFNFSTPPAEIASVHVDPFETERPGSASGPGRVWEVSPGSLKEAASVDLAWKAVHASSPIEIAPWQWKLLVTSF